MVVRIHGLSASCPEASPLVLHHACCCTCAPLQALALFRQLWDDRVVLLTGREVEAGLQAAYQCKDVELVQE
jgi:hypothetical protein